MSPNKIVGIMLLLASIAGCGGFYTPSISMLNKVSVGMTKAEVIQILGDPQASSAQFSGGELLLYGVRSNAYSDEFTVVLFQGRVAQFGPGHLQFKVGGRGTPDYEIFGN
jgi:hypothetical protein